MTLRRSTGLLNKLGGIKTNKLVSDNFVTSGGWSATQSNLTVAANALTITTASTTLPGEAYQTIATVPGRVYKISATASIGTASSYSIYAGASTGGADANRDLASRPQTNTTSETVVFSFVAVDVATRVTLSVLNGTAVGKTAVFSNVVLEEILDGFQEIMRNCNIAVFSSTQPSSADDAANGTLLYTISKDGLGVTGLTWADASNGVIAKTPAEVWRGTAVVGGVAGWFRCYEAGDNPVTASSVAARFDGAIATSGGEITMANTLVEVNAVQSVTSFTYTQPKG